MEGGQGNMRDELVKKFPLICDGPDCNFSWIELDDECAESYRTLLIAAP